MPCYEATKYEWCKDLPVVDFKELDFRYNVEMEYCIFHAPKGNKQISVEKFNELVFEEINKAKRLGKTCNLSGTIFEGYINFDQFNKDNPFPPIIFKSTVFSGAFFYNAIFNGEVDFSSARFDESANFSKATFVGKVNFRYVRFKSADFFEAEFIEKVHFSRSEFTEKLNLHQVVFDKSVDFDESTFNKGGDFKDITIKEKLRYERVNLKEVSFAGTDLRRIDFINCNWHEKNGRNILYDEIELFKVRTYTDFTDKVDEIKKVEILYRQLKQKYKEEHNEYEVSNWHYGEKEMFRKSNKWRRYLPSLSTLYWLSSGYGERPVRSGIVLSLLIILISVLFGLTGIKSIDNDSVIEIKGLVDILNMDYLKATLEYATFESKPEFIPLNWFLKIAAKLFIPLQTTLFALAVRNRFRR